jgi:histidinol-phosphatase
MPTRSPLELMPELMQLAVDAARSASDGILSGFRSKRLNTERKPDGSPVTECDRNAEKQIRAYLAKHQPENWPVLGEELGDDSRGARYRWVIDPIDGTLAFSRGLPTFGTLLALEDVVEKRALVGVVHLPAMGETYFAARGLGAWSKSARNSVLAVAGSACLDGELSLDGEASREGEVHRGGTAAPGAGAAKNGERLHVASARPLRECLISAPPEHYFRLAGIAESEAQLRAQVPHLRCFADCWAHAMVARGSIDALVEFRLARWDIAATEVLIEEAGGRAMIWDSTHTAGKYDCIIGSPTAAEEVAAIVRPS